MRFNNDGRGVITGGPNGSTRVSQAPSGGMRFEMSRMTMPALAEMLTPFVDRPVIDGTRLKDTYQVTLDLPFDAMLLVIQNLGGGRPYRVALRAFQPVDLAGALVVFLAGRAALPVQGIPEPRPTPRLRQSFSLCSNSASSSSLVRLRGYDRYRSSGKESH